MRIRLGLALVLTLFLISCGDDGSNPAIAKLTVTPATASVSAGATLTLNGNAVGFGNEPWKGWSMQEAKGTSGGLFCGLGIGVPAPSWTDCPCGYVTYDTQAGGTASEAIYHAPPDAGVFHAQFQVSAHNGFVVGLTQTTSAEITVTP